MKIEKFEFFPTLVMKFTSVLTNEQLSSIFDFCKNFNTVKHGSFIGDAKSSYSITTDILEYIEKNVFNCKDIKKDIQKLLDQYSHEYFIESTIIEQSWFNTQNKGSVLGQHIHPNSTLSAALYINTDSESSDIFFENPNPHPIFNNYYLSTNYKSLSSKYTEPFHSIHPNSGDLIVFPSWLKHGSMNTINQTNDRIVISLNTNK